MESERQLLQESARVFVLTGILLNLSIIAGVGGIVWIAYTLMAQLNHFEMFLYQIYPA